MRSTSLVALVALVACSVLACGKRSAVTTASADAAQPLDAATLPDASDDAGTDAPLSFTYDGWKATFDAAVHCRDLQRIVGEMPVYGVPGRPTRTFAARGVRLPIAPNGFSYCTLDAEAITRHPWSHYQCWVRFDTAADADRAAKELQATWETCLKKPWTKDKDSADRWRAATAPPYQRFAYVRAPSGAREIEMNVTQFSPD